MSEMDVLVLLLSGAAHDMDHPGTNNLFETKCVTKLAVLYNDQSVLENHHVASFFFMINNSSLDCNVFSELSNAEMIEMRKQVILNILHTDMSKHP